MIFSRKYLTILIKAIAPVGQFGKGQGSAIEVQGDSEIAACFVHHRRPFKAVDDLGVGEQAFTSAKGFIEAARVNEIDDAAGAVRSTLST